MDEFDEEWNDKLFIPNLTLSENVTDAIQEIRAAFEIVEQSLGDRLETWREMLGKIEIVHERIATFKTFAHEISVPTVLYVQMRGILISFILETIEAFEFICAEQGISSDGEFDRCVSLVRKTVEKQVAMWQEQKDDSQMFMTFLKSVSDDSPTAPPHTNN